MKYILGGKGANLAEMSKLGIPVPPGFTLSTEVCKEFNDNGQKYPATLKKEVEQNLAKLESATGKKFGDTKNPLLVSVRSGAASSMPGMMDTILNLGLNEDVVNSISASTGNPRFAWDSYRRFVQMYSNVVENIEHEKLEAVIDEIKDSRGIKQDTDMTATDWQEVVKAYKKLFKIEKNRDFPDDAKVQLWGSIGAVIGSWNNPRAITYRRLNHIDENKVFGTAINIQSMVFGNLGADSGTGVAFTRNPATGENLPYGEYLMNAQGEDVVAGIRTPKHLDSLKEDNEVIYKELINIFSKLEKHYRDMQDVEFTIENGRLYILQTRNGKRTAPASVKIAVDLVKEKMISQKEAILRVEPEKLEQLLHPTLDPKAKSQFKIIASGLPASPGAGVGQVVFNADTAVEWKEKGNKVILVRAETSPEDISGMNAAQGILTARGGMTSHAAVVARGMGKCCVSGCESIIVSEIEKKFRVGDLVVSEGDLITLDGSTGEVFLGEVPTINPQLSGYFGTIMEWSDKYKKLGVRTNADTPKDAAVARDFGAKGIGLCRTEHMFFEADRIFAVRQMIVSETVEQRKAALAKIFPMQKNDFKELFQIMKGFPVKIRLLDPPLHEFLPKTEAEIEAIAKEMGISASKLSQKVDYLHELNPMMGHRGCRLGVTFPEIFEMQVEAIAQAACELVKAGESIVPEIMIPLVGEFNELKWLKDRLVPIIEATIKKHGVKMTYEIGTMIEIPRAALTADTIATEADFFSFGTNDLTQMTYGFSRDDAGKFLKDYLDKKILPEDPFKSLDTIGVGKLMKMAVELGRASKKNLHIGICGEQGGDPATIKFCHEIGLDYVSCSPYRVPIARLAAAQAAIEGEK
ncbi:MAG: Pyruvate phosphate dikinase [Candidatus Shapirobacteria bacterium GW2011_GWE1_38_10]|uniref:Pyruvate, phosphate dikinase n=1 Tax=Candidatus Shapirobacteria bacterium GW2011_GWE1_38_10 TaxID=1618488 RepID=A0A0G0II47_9BACT|nr:MAG: Pyruvate phosphate dikinase [Candidatus Shapirobacteria bacterium GW2011_GWE1_38_10]